MTQDVRSGHGGLVPGDQVAGYQIQEQIGRGGMAVVYRALDLRLRRVAALKVLAPHLGEDEAFRQRFIRESRAAAGVDHPHIVPVYEAGEAGDVLFIAMRYVEHGDVRSLLDAEGPLSPSRAAVIAFQAASALDSAHAHGLVHRDVKPGNMLLARASNDTDHVYLSDFGLSKHALTPSTLTSTGQFLGTLDYVAPEQIQGHPVDGRADQYALACTVVEMLTGAPPFRRDDSMALMWAQLESEPPRLTQRRPDLPPAVDQVIAAALAKSPAGRYPTCRDFAVALAAACAPAGRPHTAAPRIADDWQPPLQAPPLKPPAPTTAGTRPALPDTRPSARVQERSQHAGNQHAGNQHAGNQRPRDLALIVVLVLACLVGLAGIGYALSHRGGPPPPATGTGASGLQAGAGHPAWVVREYFAAINHHRYLIAYRLSDQSQSEPLATFEAGFKGTLHDTVLIQSVSGDVVTARLVAWQANGTRKTFQGTYTVVNGKISKSDIIQVS